MPVSAGTVRKSSENASMPPAEAPMATTRKSFSDVDLDSLVFPSEPGRSPGFFFIESPQYGMAATLPSRSAQNTALRAHSSAKMRVRQGDAESRVLDTLKCKEALFPRDTIIGAGNHFTQLAG